MTETETVFVEDGSSTMILCSWMFRRAGKSFGKRLHHVGPFTGQSSADLRPADSAYGQLSLSALGAFSRLPVAHGG